MCEFGIETSAWLELIDLSHDSMKELRIEKLVISTLLQTKQETVV